MPHTARKRYLDVGYVIPCSASITAAASRASVGECVAVLICRQIFHDCQVYWCYNLDNLHALTTFRYKPRLGLVQRGYFASREDNGTRNSDIDGPSELALSANV